MEWTCSGFPGRSTVCLKVCREQAEEMGNAALIPCSDVEGRSAERAKRNPGAPVLPLKEHPRKRNQQPRSERGCFSAAPAAFGPTILRCSGARKLQSLQAGGGPGEGENPHDGGNQTVQHKEENIAEGNRSARLGEMLTRWQKRAGFRALRQDFAHPGGEI